MAKTNNGNHDRAAGDDGGGVKYIKPEAEAQMEEHMVLNDLQQAVRNKDEEEAARLIAANRLHTYDAEMAKRGITRGSDRWRNSFAQALTFLYEKRPFYAYLFFNVVRRSTLAIDTLCVAVINGRIELWYNPDFLALHTLRENVGFLQHEAGHLIHGHLTMQRRVREEERRDRVFAVAIDLAVDSLVQNPGDQPKWVLMPSMMRIPDDTKPPEEWTNVPERQTWRYYFDLLRDLRKNHPQQFQQQVVAVVTGRPGGDNHGQGGDCDGDGDGQDGQGGEDGNGGGGQRLTLDDHSAWDGVTKDEADANTEVVKQTVRQAMNRAENTPGGRMAGYMNGALIDQLRELVREKSVPFERVFRRFTGSHMKMSRRPTMAKLSRRRGVPPGLTRDRALKILWAQDDSGSVPFEARALCRGELWNANRNENTTILFQRFTHGLSGPMLNLDDVPFEKVMEQYNGGTDFQAVCDLADREGVDLLLIATDGYAPTPNKPRVPVGWIITHGGRTHPWGMTIRLPPVEEIKQGRKATIERWSAT